MKTPGLVAVLTTQTPKEFLKMHTRVTRLRPQQGEENRQSDTFRHTVTPKGESAK
jgi:hypothetical protein